MAFLCYPIILSTLPYQTAHSSTTSAARTDKKIYKLYSGCSQEEGTGGDGRVEQRCHNLIQLQHQQQQQQQREAVWPQQQHPQPGLQLPQSSPRS